METTQEYIWQIKETEEETPHVYSLYLEAAEKRPDFIAGQYLTIKLPHLGPAEGKSYSISSAPHQPLVRITVKEMGSFSKALLSLKTGDTVKTSAPYGFFYPEPEDTTPLAFVVGGIGITPCLSIISDLTEKSDERPINLLYSNQTEAGIVFRGELEELAAQNPHLTIHHFITRESPENTSFYNGRMVPAHFPELIPEANITDYFICGAMDFTKDIWRQLRAIDIPQHQIYTEGFF